MNKRNKKDSGPKEDLVGKRFGKLVVLSLDGKKEYPSGDSKYLWKCRCDCGNIVSPTGNALKSSNTTSCRKCLFEDLTGKSFGKLTVLSRVKDAVNESTGRKIVMWNCSCSCGNSHIVSSGNLNRGNVKSCGCLFEDVQSSDFKVRLDKFIERTDELYSGKYLYDMSDFVNTNSYLKITCPEHGVFIQRVADHLASKTGCPSCSFVNRSIGKEEFLRRSYEIHGDKYDYSLTEFQTTAGKVKIVCPDHGLFEQIAKSHMDGHECFECSILKKHWAYEERCKLNPKFGEKIGCLYLLRMHLDDESFLKVGVSVNFQNRLACYRKDGLKVEPLSMIRMTALDSAKEEGVILKQIRTNGYRYKPLKRFAGWTECVSETYEEQLLSWFDELEIKYRSTNE